MINMINELSIIVLAKNEHDNLVEILPKLQGICNDLLVIDGHSNDDTKNLCNKLNVSFFLDNGKGKGSAQRLGSQKAKNKYLIFYDGDGAPDINDIKKIYQLLKKNNLIICSRQTGGSYDLDFSKGFASAIRASGCIILTSLFNKLFDTKFTDILYSFKGVEKKIFDSLNTKSNGFTIEIDILINAVLKGCKILEIPSRENARKFGKSKLPTITGFYFIYYIFYRYFYSKLFKI